MTKNNERILMPENDANKSLENGETIGNGEKTAKPDKEVLEKKDIEIETLKKEIIKLKEEKNSLQKIIEEKHDQSLRIMAEYENLKKRLIKETEDRLKFANSEIVKNLLPVMDYLEMALHHAKDKTSIDSLFEGVELTLKQLKDILSKFGLKDLEVNAGEIFNPAFHEAMMLDYKDDADNNTVTKVMQKGYLLHNTVIRPAKVVVNKNEKNPVIGTSIKEEENGK